MSINIRINVIVPKNKVFDYEKVVREIKRVMHESTEPDLRDYFEDTTEGWKKEPLFFAHHFETNGSIGVQVYTSDSVYGIVNAGSPSHLIRPKQRGGILRFQTGYRSATRAGSLKSGAYARSGSFITAPQVRHPGFEARRFDELIAKEYEPKFVEDMNKAFAVGKP